MRYTSRNPHNLEKTGKKMPKNLDYQNFYNCIDLLCKTFILRQNVLKIKTIANAYKALHHTYELAKKRLAQKPFELRKSFLKK